MRLNLLIMACILALTGCDSDQDRLAMAMEKQISATIREDWSTGIPLDGLVEARNDCRQQTNLKGCDTVQAQLQDISLSLASCLADQRSALCQTVVRVISKHPILSILPEARTVQLPHTPFYWEMPTTALEALASNFEYRQEVASWWWKAWSLPILSCLALFTVGYAAWFCHASWLKAKKKREDLIAFQNAKRIQLDTDRRIQEEKKQIETQRQARLAHDAAIAEQARIAAEKESKQKSAEEAIRLAAERAESAKLLKAAFLPKEKEIEESFCPN